MSITITVTANNAYKEKFGILNYDEISNHCKMTMIVISIETP